MVKEKRGGTLTTVDPPPSCMDLTLRLRRKTVFNNLFHTFEGAEVKEVNILAVYHDVITYRIYFIAHFVVCGTSMKGEGNLTWIGPYTNIRGGLFSLLQGRSRKWWGTDVRVHPDHELSSD